MTIKASMHQPKSKLCIRNAFFAISIALSIGVFSLWSFVTRYESRSRHVWWPRPLLLQNLETKGLVNTNKSNYTDIMGYDDISTPSKDSVMSTRSKDSIMSARSNDSIMATRSKDSIMSTRSKDSIMSTWSKDSIMSTRSKDSIMSTRRNDSIMSTRSKDSIMSTRRNDSIMSTRSNDSIMSTWSNDSIIMFKKSSYSSDIRMTSHKFSILQLMPNALGNVVEVNIMARSGLNTSKTIGGDLFILWAEQVEGDGRVAGHVTDNNNGTYKGHIKIYWSGKTYIKAKLASTVDNFYIRRQSIIKYGDSAFAQKQPIGILAIFQKGMVSEKSRCGTQSRLYGYTNVCNFTHLNDNSPWYCGAPKSNLDCSNIYEFTNEFFKRQNSAARLSQNEIVTVFGHGELNKVMIVPKPHFYTTPQTPCHVMPKERSWIYNPPSGFYLHKTWHNLNCKNTVEFNPESYRTCLRNKTLVIFGDSTTREYTDYFMTQVLKLPAANLKFFQRKIRTYHPPIEFKNFGINLIYKRHEMPFYAYKDPAVGITSEATEIDYLADSDIPGKDIVILAHYCAHMQAFPPDLFRSKIRRLARAIKHLLVVKPEANVFIKGPHVYFEDNKWVDVRISQNQKTIIFEEFKDLRKEVIYLDIWSITVAHDIEFVHPQNQAFASQIQQFMTYLCSN